MKIHQKYWLLPMEATGAAASATNTTQMTVRIASVSLNFLVLCIFCLLTECGAVRRPPPFGARGPARAGQGIGPGRAGLTSPAAG